ncbi:MAG: GNAT family N-acetyltransferase [Dongiaceae bacterium]
MTYRAPARKPSAENCATIIPVEMNSSKASIGVRGPGAATAGEFVIRRARAGEAALLTELSLRSKAIWNYDPKFLAKCRSVMTVKTANIELLPHYVAQLDDAVVGFYGFEPEPDGVGLDYMFVEPDQIGRGVGRALWNHAVALARQLGHGALIVVSDPNAEGFYLKMGARRIGTRPSELEPGRSLPLLSYQLTPDT